MGICCGVYKDDDAGENGVGERSRSTRRERERRRRRRRGGMREMRHGGGEAGRSWGLETVIWGDEEPAVRTCR
jgi:hypothetical protein